MFFYQYGSSWKRPTFDSAFAPATRRFGSIRPYLQEVPTYTRARPDQLKGALVVGYACHAP